MSIYAISIATTVHSKHWEVNLWSKLNSIVVAWTSVVDTTSRICTSRFKPLLSCTPKKSSSLSVRIKVISRIASLHFSTGSWSINVAISMRVSGCHATTGVRISNDLLILLLSWMWFPLKKFSSATAMLSSKCCQFFFILSIDCIYFLTMKNTRNLLKLNWEITTDFNIRFILVTLSLSNYKT